MKARLAIAAIGVLAACAACGFKGPLYLPQHSTAVVTHPAAQRPANAPAAKPATSKRKSDQKNSGGATSAPP